QAGPRDDGLGPDHRDGRRPDHRRGAARRGPPRPRGGRGIPRASPLGRGRGARMTDLLAVDDVHVYYGPFHALRGNTLTVGDGEIVSLLGGNASGKSTTMK